VVSTEPLAAGPHVAIVVLSFNGCADTLSCLDSISQVGYRPLTAILVDNASTDDTVEAVLAQHPSVHVVRNETNLGFADGNNAGIRQALELGADYVLILNNDVVVEPGFLTPLVAAAQRNPDAGALCPKIVYFDRPELIWFAGATFDPRKGYNGRVTGYRRLDGPEYAALHEIDRACGAAMLVPGRVLSELGGFDPKLFLYVEDTEWSLRAREAGYRVYVVPQSRVLHKVSRAAGGESSPLALYYATRNMLDVCERFAPLGRLATWRRRGVLLAAHAVQVVLSHHRREGLRAVVAGWRDFRRGRFGPR
jgi:GT2 family glycosyltransferase